MANGKAAITEDTKPIAKRRPILAQKSRSPPHSEEDFLLGVPWTEKKTVTRSTVPKQSRRRKRHRIEDVISMLFSSTCAIGPWLQKLRKTILGQYHHALC